MLRPIQLDEFPPMLQTADTATVDDQSQSAKLQIGEFKNTKPNTVSIAPEVVLKRKLLDDTKKISKYELVEDVMEGTRYFVRRVQFSNEIPEPYMGVYGEAGNYNNFYITMDSLSGKNEVPVMVCGEVVINDDVRTWIGNEIPQTYVDLARRDGYYNDISIARYRYNALLQLFEFLNKEGATPKTIITIEKHFKHLDV